MYKKDNSGFLTFGVISLCFVWNRFHVRSATLLPFRIFWWYLVEMYNRTRWCVAYKNDNSAFLNLWHYLLLLYLTVIMCWFLVHSAIQIPLWNIFMILGRNGEQDEMTCHIQEWQLWLSYFWSYLPLFCLKSIPRSLCNLKSLWNILMVLGKL